MATNIKEVNLLCQRGNGVPNHISNKSTIFFDLDTAIIYINKDGAGDWDYLLDSSMSISGGTSSGDTYVTGFTYDNSNNLTLHRNDNVNISVNFSTFTGLTATTISATTFYGDGSQLTGISGSSGTDTYVTGGTFNQSTRIATFTNSTGGTFNVSGFNDTITTGATANNSTKVYTFTNSTGGTFNVIGLTDIYLTGGTYTNGTATFTNSTGGTFSVSGFLTGTTDTYVTGGTANNSTKVYTFTNTSGGTFNVVGLTDITITGGTYSNGTTTLTNNTGGTISISGYVISDTNTFVTGGTVSRNSNVSSILFTNSTGGTFNVTPIFDTFVTGGTYTNGTAIFTNNSGNTFSVNGFVTNDTNTFVTGGTTNNSTKIYTFTNSTGGTFNVTGLTDVNTTGVTFTNNLLSINNNTGGTSTVLINTMTGLTINGSLNFGTGNTIPTNVSGRVFYNSIEQAMAYYPNANQDVIVNIGQQQYIRVNNASGTIITKGAVVNTITASGGTPSITLAISTGLTGNNVIGLAAHNIGVGSQGLVLTNGLLSGLTLNTFNVGDIIYLSDTIAGSYINNTSTLSNNSRINEIGYITATGTSLGQIFVNIKNENTNELLTIKQKNLLVEDSLSTGVYIFTGLTKISSTTFSIAPVSGWIVNNTGAIPLSGDINNVLYTGVTATTTPYLASADATYVLITSANTITLQSSYPTPAQRRNNIYLGRIVHPNRISIDFAINSPDFNISPISQLRDIMTPIKLINDGVVPSSNGVNLTFKTSSGTLYGLGINWTVDTLTPDSVTISASTPVSFQYRTSTGGTFTATTSIVPNIYDVNGVATALPGGGNTSTNQRIYVFPSNQYRVQYGQTTYTSLANAIAGLDSEVFIENPNLRDNGLLIGVVSVRKNATDLSDTSDAKFAFTSKFGEIFGGTGGISTTTLQQAYNNSTVPQIITTAGLDGFSIQNGTGGADNITTNLKILNTAGGITSFIKANGDISGNTISATTITATTISAATYYNVPDVFGVNVNGQGAMITTGVTDYKIMTTNGTITGWNIISTITGSVVFDVWKVSGGVLPTVANSITDGTKPQLSSSLYSGSTNVAGWTTSFLAGDTFGFAVNSVSSIVKATLSITYVKS